MAGEHTLYFLIGASGSGKSTIAKLLEREMPKMAVLHFDSIGVPSVEDMIKEFGGVDEWQRAKTIEWVKTIAAGPLQEKPVLFDAQTRPSFISEACAMARVPWYKIILFDCTDDVRRNRLGARGQLELAHDEMMNWAKYLREECHGGRCTTINTSKLTIEGSLDALHAAL